MVTASKTASEFAQDKSSDAIVRAEIDIEFPGDLAAARYAGAEGIGVDSKGNIYGAVVRRRMLEKHVPKR
jgi:hypothetical protein